MNFIDFLQKLLPLELALIAAAFFYLLILFKHISDKFIKLAEDQAKYTHQRLEVIEKSVGISDKTFDFHKKQIKELEEIALKQGQQLSEAAAAARDAENRLVEAERSYDALLQQVKLSEEQRIGLAAAKLATQATVRREVVLRFSHELLGPIQSLSANIANIVEEAKEHGSGDAYVVVLDRIIKQIQAIALTVRSLTASTWVPSEMSRSQITSNLEQALRRTVPLFEDEASSKCIEIQVRFDTEPPFLVGVDPDDLQIVLFTLLSNAVKYSWIGNTTCPANINIVVAREDRSLVLIIENTGAGILPAEISRVFEEGYRGALALDRNRTGMGIGLTTACNLVTAASGQLMIESKEINQQTYLTRVRVKFPMDKKK